MAGDAYVRAGIALDGEKEFKAAVAGINKDLSVLTSEMRKVTSEFADSADAQKAAAAQAEVYEKQITKQREKIDTIRAALESARKEYGENSKQVKDWQIKLNNAEAQLNDTENALKNLRSNLDDAGEGFDEAGGKALTFGDLLKANLLSDAIVGGIRALGSAIATLTGNIIELAEEGIDYNAQMEQYTTSFTTMLGDEAKAQQLVIELRKEAAATPFGMSDLANAQQTLMSFGISADEALTRIKQLGDVSQGNAERFKSLSLAFAQVSSTGRLTGQDLLQLINAGFNPLEEIARKTGKSMAELKDEMSKGAISAQMVADAFASATSEGGRFYGAMEAQSKTFAGQLATLQDNIDALKGQLTEGLQAALTESVLPMVNGWVEEVSAAFETDGVDGLIVALGKVLREAAEYMASQAPVIVRVGGDIVTSLLQGITANLPEISDAAFDAVREFVEQIIVMTPQILLAGVDMVTTLLNGIAEALPSIIPAAAQAITQFVQGLTGRLPDILQAGIDIIMGLVQGIINAIPVLIDALPLIITTIVDFLLGAQPQILKATIQLFRAMLQAMPEILAAWSKAIPELITGLIETLTSQDTLNDMAEAGVELMGAIFSDIPAILDAWGQVIPNIIKGLIEKLIGADIEEQFGEVGAEWMEWIIAGMASYVAGPLPILTKIVKALKGEDITVHENEEGNVRGGGGGGQRFGDNTNQNDSQNNETAQEVGSLKDSLIETLTQQTGTLAGALADTTTAVKSLSTTIEDVSSRAGITLNDTVDTAAQKIVDEITESQKLKELIAQAEIRAQELLENAQLERWDDTIGRGIGEGEGYIKIGDKITYFNADKTRSYGTVGDDGKIAWSNVKTANVTNNTSVVVNVDVSKIKNLDDILQIANNAKLSARMGYAP